MYTSPEIKSHVKSLKRDPYNIPCLSKKRHFTTHESKLCINALNKYCVVNNTKQTEHLDNHKKKMRKSLASWLEKYNTTNDFCGMTGFNYILLRKKYILKKSWLMSTGYSRASTLPPTPNIKLLFLKYFTTNLRFFIKT